MSVKSNLEWKLWGERDPLWAVASWKSRDKAGAKPWTDEEFYALGKSDWKDFHAHWVRYGLEPEACVEIGCGAGRLTFEIAGSFAQVHGLDVSSGMLAYAEQHRTRDNVAFHLVSGGDIPLPDASVSGVFSTHVFQHLESAADVYAYFAEMGRVVKPGGTIMIHIPVFSWPLGTGRSVRLLYHLQKKYEDVSAAIKRRVLARGAAVKLMRMNSYHQQHLYRELAKCGFTDIEVSVFAVSSNNDPHPFVFARKRAR